MGPRELIFGVIAVILMSGYLVFGSQLYAQVGPSVAPTPMPTAPRTELPAPRVPGTLAFALQGDIYVMREGKFHHETSEARNQQPALSPNGTTLAFARRQQIEGRSVLGNGQTVNARLGYSDLITKPATGGAETIVLSGLRQRAQNGFHRVSWLLAPAFSPDGRRIAYIEDAGLGSADLWVIDIATRRQTQYSNGANLADPAWSPDGRTIATTTYNTDTPGLLLWTAPGVGTRIADLPEGEAYRPSFSPDGERIIYTLRVGTRNDVHLVEVRTGRDVALTSDGRSWNGVVSPDGGWVAFLRERGGVIDLHAMELAQALSGGVPKEALKLTTGQGIDGASRPAWSR